MSMTGGNIVTVNTGSSSIKLAVFAMSQHTLLSEQSLFTISVSNIGQPTATLQVIQPAMPTRTEEVSAASHIEASRIIIERLADMVAANSIVAIGHRLVHGGMKYTSPTVIENITNADWELLSQLDPEHTPSARQLVTQFTQRYPGVPEIACFDTAFFRDMPYIAKIVPIPQKYFTEGVRRYGFHGLSYASLLKTFGEQAGEAAANGRVILAHLGSGTSVTAMRNRKPIDTTMGFTPTSGVVMSTRSGDLDPNVFSFLQRQHNISVDEFDHMVRFESGLLGVSGVTGDMRTLLAIEHENKDAVLAVELFVRGVKKAIGALAATLGGVDSVIFSGGIGEQSAVLRLRICEGLEYMGIEIDEAANEQHDFLISAEYSRVGVYIIPADEARVIAKQTIALVKKNEV